MNELGPGHNPEEDVGAVLSEDNRRLLLEIAESKRLGFALRVESKNIALPDPTLAVKAKYEQDRELLNQEASGEDTIDPQIASDFLDSESEQTEKEAQAMASITPEYSGYLMSIVAKNEQSAGQPYQESLAEAQKLFASGHREIQVPSDLMGKAVSLGIISRETHGKPLPAVEQILPVAMEDEEVLRAIALALNEEEKAKFMSLVPNTKKNLVAATFDHEGSKLLRHTALELSEEEPAKQIRVRVESRLTEMLKGEEIDPQMVKLLAGTLCQMGGGEALGILKIAAKGGIEKTGERHAEKMTARIIYELLKEDRMGGSSLAMSFIGSEAVNDHYFDFFLNYLADNNLIQQSFDQVEHWSEEKCQKLYEVLKNKMPELSDEQIAGPLEAGVKIFGLQKMLHFAGRPDVGLHDAMFAFNQTVGLYERSGLAASEFYGRILNQVYSDGSTYQSGNSYQELNSIASSINLSSSHLATIREKAERYKNIDRLHGLVELLAEPQNIFASWNNLRKFAELSGLLDRAEVLEQLSRLKTESETDERKAKLYRYIETIAFHEDSRVDMAAVMQFWRNPESFLEVDDDTSGTLEAHRSKKPSNYIEIPNLDLTAAELRDSLVCGELDRIQVFKPMEIIYSVEQGASLQTEATFFQTIQTEIGSRKDGTANTRLFHALRQIFSGYGFSVNEFVATQGECLGALPAIDLEEVKRKVGEAISQFPNEKIEREARQPARRFRARINLKSDPQAVLAGNDTACCMPFGSGKNNVYMFNPNCAMFTLEEAKGPDRWRTIAQSVLTLDKDIKRPIPEVIEELKVNRYNLADVLPEEAVMESDCYVSCDNIEIAGNAASSHKIIEAVYRDFFERYLTQANNQSSGVPISQEKIIIGQGYSDLRYGDREENTYAPLAPVAYSDKSGPQVDVIRFASGQNQGVVLRPESEPQAEEEVQTTPETPRTGILPLTFTDTLAVAYIEGKAYKSNESLLAYLHNMENGLIAKDVNNENKSRPNLSLKYVDPSGKVRGYLFAYEGESERGEPMVFVSDLASDLESQMAGGRLINGFVDIYQREYVTTGKMTPIYVEAREKTAYPVIMGSIDRIAERLGIRIQVQEVGTQRIGDDIMHEIWLRPSVR
jgi:hypothetical protein